MTLPASGSISAYQINEELARVGNNSFSLNGAAERGLSGVNSGSISFSNFHGKASLIRQPATGEYYQKTQPFFYWLRMADPYNKSYVYWNNTQYPQSANLNALFLVYNGWKYYRGAFHDEAGVYQFFSVYRIKT